MLKKKKIHVKVGDTVKIISGSDKNKIGEVIKIYHNSGKIIVEYKDLEQFEFIQKLLKN